MSFIGHMLFPGLPPRYSNFAEAASRVERSGGALKIGDKGKFAVEGETRFGRIILWLKCRFTPGRMRAQNHEVLDTLNRVLQRKADVKDAGLILKRATKGISVREPEQFAAALHRTAEQQLEYADKKTAARPAINQADRFFLRYFGAPFSTLQLQARHRKGTPLWNSTGAQAAREKGIDSTRFRDAVFASRKQAADFAGYLATRDEVLNNRVPGGGKNASLCKTRDGKLTDDFVARALWTVVGNKGSGHTYRGRGWKLADMPLVNDDRAELNTWMAQQYQNYIGR